MAKRKTTTTVTKKKKAVARKRAAPKKKAPKRKAAAKKKKQQQRGSTQVSARKASSSSVARRRTIDDDAIVVKPGDVSRAMQRALEAEFTPEDIAGKLREQMEAVYIKKPARGDGGEDPVEVPVPDYKAREGALKLTLSYVLGLPVQKTEIVERKILDWDDIVECVKHSSALRDDLLEVLVETYREAEDSGLVDALERARGKESGSEAGASQGNVEDMGPVPKREPNSNESS